MAALSLLGSVVVAFANVTTWGDKVETFAAADPLAAGFLGFAETHIARGRRPAIEQRLLASGWRGTFADAPANRRSAAGRAATGDTDDPGRATTGGVVQLVRPSLGARPFEPALALDFAAGVLWRSEGLTTLIMAVYLDVHSAAVRHEQLARLGRVLRLLTVEIVLMGDWNMDPGEMLASSFPARARLTLRQPAVQATCLSGRGRVLDYCLLTHGLAELVQDPEVFTGPWRPHLGLVLRLPRRPRAALVAKVGRPRVALHLGPDLPWEVHRAWAARAAALLPSHHEASAGGGAEWLAPSAELDNAFDQFTLAAEAALAQRAGLTPTAAASGSRWRSVVRPMRDAEPAHYLYKCRGACWWSTMAARLSELAHYAAGGRLDHPRAERVRRSCPAHVPTHAAPTADQSYADWGWAAVLASIRAGETDGADRLAECAAEADRLCRRELGRAARRAAHGWREWLGTALRGGAGRAHAWARRAAADPWPALMRGADGAPLTLPAERAAAKHRHWSQVWRAEDTELARRLDTVAATLLAEPLPPIERATFDAAFKGLRMKGVGLDGLLGQALWTLPAAAHDDLFHLVQQVEREGRWPRGARWTRVVFLLKGDGTDRAIAVGGYLSRLWQRCRRPDWVRFEAGLDKPWDSAASGAGCVAAAGRRAARAEVAVLRGDASLGVFWDLKGFFDSIGVEELIQEAAAHQFNGKLLMLSLAQHLAPRLLTTADHDHDEPVVPGRSILAGAIDSTTLAKMLLQRCLRRVVDSFPGTRADAHIDDVAQLTTGSADRLVSRALAPALMLGRGFASLGLVVSPKTVVVGSAMKQARALAGRLQRHGFPATAAVGARDVGIDHGGGRRRARPTLRKRFAAGLRRLARSARAARTHRGARRLALSGGAAQALWGLGAAGGLSAADRRRYRAKLASAVGPASGGRCAGTAIALHLGVDADPLISIPCLVLQEYFQIWTTAGHDLQAEIREVWAKLRRIHAPRPQWRAVRGPIGAAVALLAEMGWAGIEPDVVLDATGQRWSYDGAGPIAPFLAVVRAHLRQQVYRQLAEHHCGAGALLGVDWVSGGAYLRKLKASPDRRGDATLLELGLCGGFWTGQRRHRAGYASSPRCQRCLGGDDTDAHWLWQCPCNLRMDPDITASQVLAERALAEHRDNPLLWLRGLAPAAMLPTDGVGASPPLTWGAFPATLQGTLVGTDGSGGGHSADRRLRRCAYSLVVVGRAGRQPARLAYAEWGGLPVECGFGENTVPQAELHALTRALLLYSGPEDLHIITDSQLCWRRWRRGPSTTAADRRAPPGMQARWCEFWAALAAAERKGAVRIHWRPSHLTAEDALSRWGPGSPEHDPAVDPSGILGWHANQLADRFAGLAARAVQLGPRVIERYGTVDNLVEAVQRRIIAVAKLSGIEKATPIAEPGRARLQAWLARRSALLAGRHLLVRLPGRNAYTCRWCSATARGPAAIGRVFGVACTRRPGVRFAGGQAELARASGALLSAVGSAHPTHLLQARASAVLCIRCGAWTTGAPRGLRSACAERPASRGAQSCLRRWVAGLPPIPPRAGTRRWTPDATAAEEPLLVSPYGDDPME